MSFRRSQIKQCKRPGTQHDWLVIKNSWNNQPIKKIYQYVIEQFLCKDGKTLFSDSTTCLSWFESHSYFCTHHESDGSLLVDVDGDVGALDPGVGAQVSQSYVRVSGRQTAHFMSTSALLISLCSSVEVYTLSVDSLIWFSGVCAINFLYLFCFSSSSETVSIKCLTSFN